MRIRCTPLCLAAFLLGASCAGQDRDTSGFRFLPSGRMIATLRASVAEPRLGVFKSLDASDMKVDVGNAIDLFGYDAGSVRFRAGIDFFAFALTTGHEGLRLQIDALDGFFGGDLSAHVPIAERHAFEARFRAMHHSAHLADGHLPADGDPGNAVQSSPAVPFTRDFGELTVMHLYDHPRALLRTYAGIGYATLARPTVYRRTTLFGGVECYDRTIAGRFFDAPVLPYLACNVFLAGTPVYRASNQIQAGVKFGEWNGKGPTLYAAYYNGMRFFGEYFTERFSTVGAGFTVDF